MKRSKFSLSHYKLFTCDMGELVPCGLLEVLPGDTVQHSTSALIRCSPLLAPVMHPVHVRIHHWFVPHRLVWEDWEDFITGGPDGLNDSSVPDITFGGGSGAAVGSLADYLGVPTGVNNVNVCALAFRGYARIWNDWYRDADLQTPLVVDTSDGDDTTTNTVLQNVCWEKDYFTSARPWEQKGPSISLPLGTTAPVTGFAVPAGAVTVAGDPAGSDRKSGGDVSTWAHHYGVPFSGASTNDLFVRSSSSNGPPQLETDLAGASAVTINALREALAIQRYEEARARFGSRYVEYLRYLGVRSSDARLQRPEYLGGGRQTIQFSEVLQTAVPAAGATVVGEMRGHGISALRSNRYRRFFEEHGYVFSLMSVKPKTMYSQGIARHYIRGSKDDWWQKEFQNLGQQRIENKELYAAHSNADGTFGYQDRYDEYRRMESGVAGDFRTVLNHWHFARDFSADPALNATFVKSVPTERTFAVSTNDVLWIMANHSIQARRLVAPVAVSKTF